MGGRRGSDKRQEGAWTEISLRDKQWTRGWMGCRNKGQKHNGQRSQMDTRIQRRTGQTDMGAEGRFDWWGGA